MRFLGFLLVGAMAFAGTACAAGKEPPVALEHPLSSEGWPHHRDFAYWGLKAAWNGRPLEACTWALLSVTRHPEAMDLYEGSLLMLSDEEKETCRRDARAFRPGDWDLSGAGTGKPGPEASPWRK